MEVLREGARSLLAQALEMEIKIFTKKYKDVRMEDHKPQIVRNERLPKRSIQTWICPIAVEVPRIKDRAKRVG